jgi:hypothetical protein
MNGTQKITQEEIQVLPRWARLAFAARCVRRARALLQGPGEPLAVIDRAIHLVEQACRKAYADDQLADAAASAYTFALNAIDLTDHPADQEDRLIVACSVIHAAAIAAEAATIAAAKMAAYRVVQSIDSAVHAYLVADPESVPEIIGAMRADLERLQDAVVKEGWGNLMPVAPDFFGPLQ